MLSLTLMLSSPKCPIATDSTGPYVLMSQRAQYLHGLGVHIARFAQVATTCMFVTGVFSSLFV